MPFHYIYKMVQWISESVLIWFMFCFFPTPKSFITIDMAFSKEKVIETIDSLALMDF